MKNKILMILMMIILIPQLGSSLSNQICIDNETLSINETYYLNGEEISLVKPNIHCDYGCGEIWGDMCYPPDWVVILIIIIIIIFIYLILKILM